MKLKTTILSFVSILLVIGFLEICIGSLALLFPKVEVLLLEPWDPGNLVMPDDRLEYRPRPGVAGHDKRGFRNTENLDKAQIVVLGDSQTYGTGVATRETWPSQLSVLTGQSVYNMAFSGYGPIHSLALWEEAVFLKPNIIIEAFYSGNDLYDSFKLVYKFKQFTELKNMDPSVQAATWDMEKQQPIIDRINKIVGSNKKISVKQDNGVRGLLAKHSNLYALARRLMYEISHHKNTINQYNNDIWDKARAAARANKYQQIFDDGKLKTILTPTYRLTALDLDDPRIAEGRDISWQALKKMNEYAALKNIKYLVLLIPTKELAFDELVESSNSDYNKLINTEKQFWNSTKAFLDNNNISYMDALPVLQEKLANGSHTYHVSHDGHPNKVGHRTIAELVAGTITELYKHQPDTSHSGQ